MAFDVAIHRRSAGSRVNCKGKRQAARPIVVSEVVRFE